MLQLDSYSTLAEHATKARQFNLSALFAADPKRAQQYQINVAGINLDYSKNLIDHETKTLFAKLSKQAGLVEHFTALMQGAIVNNTEQRAALHTLLRAPLEPEDSSLRSKSESVHTALNRVKHISERIRSGDWRSCNNSPIKHIVHIGIGGSYLGPNMIDQALSPYRTADDISCHYVANVDGAHIQQLLSKLDAKQTLVIIVSKSFATMETMTNAKTAQKWLLASMAASELPKHQVAITTNIEAAKAFGIAEENLIPIWDWVGGRYSLWSGVSLPIAIRYGFEAFEALLEGAHEIDQHTLNADCEHNMPMMLAWISVFYQQFFDAQSHAVLVYDHGLRLLPEHLQQVDMESNGKSVTAQGKAVDGPTGAILWGGEGCNGQHAFHQLLHQGTRFVGIDFILPLKPKHDLRHHHDQLAASCFSQAQALMLGRDLEAISQFDTEEQKHHKVMPGNRPSNMILLDEVSPKTLGALVALYEHKIFFQAMLWRINPFDQWGVELGKELGDVIFAAIQNNTPSLDGSTDQLIQRYKAANNISRGE